jgi:hypothetical protein
MCGKNKIRIHSAKTLRLISLMDSAFSIPYSTSVYTTLLNTHINAIHRYMIPVRGIEIVFLYSFKILNIL